MSLNWDLIAAYTILFPVIAGILSGKWRDQVFQPLFICFCVGAMNEVGIYFIRLYKNKPLFYASANSYYFIETVLYMWFFYRVGVIKQRKHYHLWQLTVLVLFLVSAIVRSPLNSYAETQAYIFFTILFGAFSIQMLAVQVLDIRIPVLKNPFFLIGIGFLLLNTFSVFMDMLTIAETGEYWLNAAIYRWVNVSFYFLCTYAFLCHK